MTDGGSGASSLSQTKPGQAGGHFLVTCVEQSTQDASDSEDLDHPKGEAVKTESSEADGVRGVVFKIGDSSVFGGVLHAAALSSSALQQAGSQCTAMVDQCPLAGGAEASGANLLHSHSSRFHIVKLENNPYRRGRWMCKDKEEPRSSSELPEKRKLTVHFPATVPAISKETAGSASSPALVALDGSVGKYPPSPAAVTHLLSEPSSSSTCPPVTDSLSKAADLDSSPTVTASAPDDAVQQPRTPGRTVAVPVVILVNGEQNAEVDPAALNLQSLRPKGPSSIDSVVEQLSTDQMWKELESQAATGAGASTDSGVTSSEVAIDNKIEQAMDLVKTHLLYAVREEVDLFKERIEKLERISKRLEAENKLLREHASPEVLAQLGPLLASKGFLPAPATATPPVHSTSMSVLGLPKPPAPSGGQGDRVSSFSGALTTSTASGEKEG